MAQEHQIFNQIKERINEKITELEERKAEVYYIFEKGKYLSRDSIMNEMNRINDMISECMKEKDELDIIEFSFLRKQIVNIFYSIPKKWFKQEGEEFRIIMNEDKWGELVLAIDKDNVRSYPMKKDLNIIQINVLQKYAVKNLNIEIFGGRLAKKIINYKEVNEVKF